MNPGRSTYRLASRRALELARRDYYRYLSQLHKLLELRVLDVRGIESWLPPKAL